MAEDSGVTAGNAKSMTLEDFLIKSLSTRHCYINCDVTLSAETKNPILQLRSSDIGSVGFEVSKDSIKVVTYTPKPPKPTEQDHCCAVCDD